MARSLKSTGSSNPNPIAAFSTAAQQALDHYLVEIEEGGGEENERRDYFARLPNLRDRTYPRSSLRLEGVRKELALYFWTFL